MKNKQNNAIFLDIITDCTPVPNILLEYYPQFGLDEKEVLFLLELLRLKSRGVELSIKEVVANSHYNEEDVPMILARLVEDGFVAVSRRGEISLSAFFEKIREAWGWREARNQNRAMEQEQTQIVDQEFSAIYLKFQDEMGRPLSSIEGEQIKDWFTGLSMTGEMIYEALKKAVLLDKRNFQYINKILLDWHGKGYKTLEDVKKGEEAKSNRPVAKKPGAKKYRDNQNEDIFEDVFEVN